MIKVKKSIALLLVFVVMLTGTLSGCGKKKEANTNTSATETTGQVNAYGWEIPKETIKINVFSALQSSPDDMKKYNEKMRAYLLKNFNVDLNIFCYDTDPDERLNLMLSSDDYPECISYLSAAQAQKFINMNKALPLDELVDNTNDLKKRYERYSPMLRSDDNKLYQLLVQCNNADLDLTIPCVDTAPMLRLDWYKEIGSPDISTPEKYLDALKQMVANHPTTPSGKKTYGISFYDTKSSSITPSFISWIGGMFGLKQGWDIDSSNNVVHWLNSEKGMKLISWLNRLYREGLLDPEGFMTPIETWGEKGVDQRYAGYIGPWFQPGYYISDNWMKLMGDKYTEDMRYVHYNVKDPSIEQATYNPKSALGYRVILTDKCKNPADYMRWFDFEQSDLGVKLMGYGIPNEPDSIWTFDENTKEAKFTDKAVKEITADKSSFDFDPYMMLGGECQMVITGTQEKLSDGTNCWFNQTNKDKWKKLKDENLKDTIYDNTAMAAIVMDPDDPLTAKKQRCADIIMTGYSQAILAKTEEECKSIIEKTKQNAISAGLNEIQKFYDDNYKANLKKWGK